MELRKSLALLSAATGLQSAGPEQLCDGSPRFSSPSKNFTGQSISLRHHPEESPGKPCCTPLESTNRPTTSAESQLVQRNPCTLPPASEYWPTACLPIASMPKQMVSRECGNCILTYKFRFG